MATSSPARRRLSGRARKSVLLLHIVAAAAWLGIDLALGILVTTALLTDDAVVAGVSLQAVPLFAIWPMFGASLLCIVTGTVLGLGSKYGVLRYWWVVVKGVINVLMTVLIVAALRPDVDDAAAIGRRMVAGDPTAEAPSDLLAPVIVAPSLLLAAYLLSVFKPWGRIRRMPRTAAQLPRERELSRV